MSSGLKNIIGLSFIFIAIYCVAVLFNWTIAALMMVSISPFVVICLVYKVLTDANPSQKTFDQHFYEDYDYERSR